jgi:hypothetical protein
MTYVLMTATPKLRGKAKKFSRGYLKFAVVELKPGFTDRPKMISERAIGVKRIVSVETHYVGETERSYGYQRFRAASDLVDQLNGEAQA